MYNEKCYQLGAQPNGIRKLFAYGLQKAKEIGPENVFDYSIGNPSIPSPAKVNESICDIVNTEDSIKVHGYSMSVGFDDVRDSIAADLSSRCGLSIKGSSLFLTCGAAPALLAVIKALCVEETSEIVILAPFFPEYVPFTVYNGGVPVIVPPDMKAFQIDAAQVESYLTPNTQAVIVNSPNNPSGVVYSEETLKSLADLLTRKSEEYGHPIYIISDEPYRELVYGGVVVPFLPCIYKNTIVCYSYSKSLSLPGERIGYVYVPEFADDAADVYLAIAGAARASGHICPPTLFQKVVGRCASERPDLEAYDKNRILLYEALTEIGYNCVKPDGAFYLFVKAPGGDSIAFSERAKLGYNLLLVPADAFGCPGYVRLSYAVSNDMIHRSLPAFRELLKEYV